MNQVKACVASLASPTSSPAPGAHIGYLQFHPEQAASTRIRQAMTLGELHRGAPLSSAENRAGAQEAGLRGSCPSLLPHSGKPLAPSGPQGSPSNMQKWQNDLGGANHC